MKEEMNQKPDYDKLQRLAEDSMYYSYGACGTGFASNKPQGQKYLPPSLLYGNSSPNKSPIKVDGDVIGEIHITQNEDVESEYPKLQLSSMYGEMMEEKKHRAVEFHMKLLNQRMKHAVENSPAQYFKDTTEERQKMILEKMRKGDKND